MHSSGKCRLCEFRKVRRIDVLPLISAVVSHITVKRLAALLGLAAMVALSAGACSSKDSASTPTVVTGPAPDSFRATFETSRGPFVVEIRRAWAPRGADRFYELARTHFFDDNRFFRVVPDFVAQFGLSNDLKLNGRWDDKPIADDSVRESNVRGTLTFATQGPGSRTHQLFFNLKDNARLDRMGFAPIGRVVEGMPVVDSLYSGYGDEPNQHLIQTLGESYLRRSYPKLDYIKRVRVQGDTT